MQLNRRQFMVAVAAVTAAVAHAKDVVVSTAEKLIYPVDEAPFFLMQFKDAAALNHAFRNCRIEHEDRVAFRSDPRNFLNAPDGSVWVKMQVQDRSFIYVTDYDGTVPRKEPACSKALVYMAKTIVFVDKGSWVRDMKVRDEYFLPREMMTTKYKAQRFYRRRNMDMV